MKKLPRLALTLGDPAGIGPEIIVRAWSDPSIHQVCRPVVFGHPEVLRQAVALVNRDNRVELLNNLEDDDRATDPAIITCYPVGDDDLLQTPHGEVDARTGEAAFQAVVQAIDATLADRFQGIVTAPLSKAALHAAGHHYPGHTELLAERCGDRNGWRP